MSQKMKRREFLGKMGMATAMFTPLGQSLIRPQNISSPAKTINSRVLLSPFDYEGVLLLPSRWQQQFASGCDYYLNVSDDDILHGFRKAAGLSAPGAPLGGWAYPDSSVIFGQWLQAMARASRSFGNNAMRDKAVKLVEEWAKTIGPDGNPRMGHYPWEKMVGGLVDLYKYTGHTGSLQLLDRIVDWGLANLDRTRTPAANSPWELHSGKPLEWYTLSENLYRAYLVTGKARYKEFADVWRYDAYWNKFAETSQPPDAHGVHAYSHCNSFSGAALAYLVEGDSRLLLIMKNFYDYLQNSQCYATGGYGPAERYVLNDGALGDSLAVRLDSFEAPCCSWAAFKLSKYLMAFTTEARYGDWMENLLYNGVGAALPITDRGKHFYYANYQLGAAMKIYSRNTYACCSGTYFQDIVEYQNLVYFHDQEGLYVNLFLPSSVSWEHRGSVVKLRQETDYPENELIKMSLTTSRPITFVLKLRIPAWSKGVTLEVNGTPVRADIRPGYWAEIKREWKDGDQIKMVIPLVFRRVPVDHWHPDRVAIKRGPVVYAQQVVHKHLVKIPPDDEALNDWLIETDNPTIFRYRGQEQSSQRDDFMPYYRFGEMQTYRIYFDPGLRSILW